MEYRQNGVFVQEIRMAEEPNPLFRARKDAGMSRPQLAELAGTSPQQIEKLEKGIREMTRLWAERLAPHLDVSPTYLVFPSKTSVPVMGRVGAGAEIEPEAEQVPQEGLFEVEVPLLLPSGMIGFEVVGSSMYPRYDEGDVIVCPSDGEPQALRSGVEAAVRTDQGRRFLKKVIRSGDGFTLESHNAPPMRDVALAWASPVYLTVRRENWKRMEYPPRKLLQKPVSHVGKPKLKR